MNPEQRPFGQLALPEAKATNSKGYRHPRDEHQGESITMFECLGKAGARKKLNQVEDEANSHPDLMEEDPDHNFALAMLLWARSGYQEHLLSTNSTNASFTCSDLRDG